jgi:zinc/manganese transport system permease protein
MFDHESILLMFQALAICLVLTGIHGYLGIHVLERKVIFVDLAMAQIAALGATYALVLGYDEHENPTAVYLFSLAFTLAGAAVFSLTRMRHEKVPQEAFIGIIYATASALAILILARSTTAGEHLKGMLVGNILRARWRPTILQTAAIYGAIGAFHWHFRDRFFRISMDPEGAYKDGVNVRLWDFLFYATFGVVITSSVAIAGVLLVFSFLVVPACIGVMFAGKPLHRILVAWGAGTAVSILGIFFTFQQGDFPPGPVVVAAFALALALSGIVRYLGRAERIVPALARVGSAVAAVAVVLLGSYLLRKPAPAPEDHAHESEFDLHLRELGGDETRQLHAIDHFLSAPDPHAVPPLLDLLERTRSDRVIEHLAATLKRLGDPKAVPGLRKATERTGLDASLRLALAEAILELKDPSGVGMLLALIADAQAPRLPRMKALRLFQRFTGRGSDVELDGDPQKLERVRQWWSEHGSHIKWRENTGRFE